MSDIKIGTSVLQGASEIHTLTSIEKLAGRLLQTPPTVAPEHRDEVPGSSADVSMLSVDSREALIPAKVELQQNESLSHRASGHLAGHTVTKS